MITQEILVDIHVLHRQGLGIRAIAKKLNLSRNTVRSYLRAPTKAPTYSERVQRPSILDPYKPYLLERIEAAKPHWIPATVLHREIRERGYTGGVSTIKVFVRAFKSSVNDPVVRFETEPGEQMQVDFTIIRRGRNALKAFVATMGFSRGTYVKFSSSENQQDWLEGIKGALEYFGGVPKEILFDNAKSIMIQRDAYGDGKHQWNAQLLDQANTYGYRPRACRPYRAKTKGKVERFNSYLKQCFVTPLSATLKQAGLTLSVEAANAHIGTWLNDVAHQRTHGTTNVKPQIRMDKELQYLQPLPLECKAVNSPIITNIRPLPVESFQHPLDVYDQLLEVAP